MTPDDYRAIRLPLDLYRQLEAQARANERSTAAELRVIVTAGLKEKR